MSKIKYFLEQSWLLIVSSFFFGLLIAVTYAALEPKINANESAKVNVLVGNLITNAANFEQAMEQVPIELGRVKIVKTDIYRGIDSAGKTAGFAYIAEGAGFADKIKLVIAADSKFQKFLGFKVLASNETPNFGDKIKDEYYKNQFIGAPTGKFELVKAGDPEKIDSEIVAISGATVSSQAVVNIFNSYTDKIKELLVAKGLIEDGR